jgi:hydrogenase maturation protease
MSRVLVIGYGNMLRGDDGAGICAAEGLAERHPEFEIQTVHQLVPELTEAIRNTDLVFFLDAQIGIEQVTVQTLEPAAGQLRTHLFFPEVLLALCKELYDHLPRAAYSIGIPAGSLEFSEKLSTETKRQVQKSIEAVETIVTGEMLNEWAGRVSRTTEKSPTI